ncbi:cation-translocating P-type ATPase [Methylomagnum sp.]
MAALATEAAPFARLIRQPAPGRLRVKVRGLYRSEPVKLALEELARTHADILSVSANELTGQVLICHVPGGSPEDILAAVETRARSQWRAEPMAEAISPVVPAAKPKASKPRSRRESPAAQAMAEIAAQPPQECWHARPVETALNLLDSRPEGLADTDAARRLAVYGGNRLAEKQRRSALSLFAGQFTNPPVAMLGVSAGISIATGGVVDAVAILGVVLINAAIGYVTESEAEKTINALGNLGATHTLLLREGREVPVPVEAVVPGDVLVLRPGSQIAADARLLKSSRLTVDESSLTGESLPVAKNANGPLAADAPLADRHNMVYMGSIVTGGSGLAVVVATGRHTEIGLIQSLVGEVETPATPLQQQLDQMGLQLAVASSVLCAGVFGLGVLRGTPGLAMLKSAMSLAVAAVPEGLPAVATTTLALGIRKMRERHVLVRQLPAVEGLGSVQTLCLDKTGTLTLNRMKAVSVELPGQTIELRDDGFYLDEQPVVPETMAGLVNLARMVCLCSEVKSNGHGLEGSPTERALVEIALATGEDLDALRQTFPLVKTIHRAEDRPYMATLHEQGEGRYLVAVKGSPSDVLNLCAFWQSGADILPLDDELRVGIQRRNEAMAGEALRVLGVAFRHSDGTATADATSDLVWLGLAGMEDSLRPGMADLMGKFHRAGIQTVMITGDQSATAYSVGKRLGMNHDKPLEIVDSNALEQLDPEILAGMVKDVSIFARVSPAHKLRIVQALQKAGRVVAMTGDGVNDGPALKAANIGVAMGDQGTEVARSVSDVVLEDDNLHTMIAAVEQGRTIYRNIRKSLRFLLSSNLSEIEIMLVGTALGHGEVLNPMQLLWINLITDILPGIGLAVEPPEKDVLDEPPRNPDEPIVRREDALKMLRESLFLTGGTLVVHGLTLARTGNPAIAGSHAFMTLTLAQLLHSLSCRSETTTVLNRGRPPNRFLGGAVVGSVLLQLSAVAFPPLRTLLRLTPPGPGEWLMIGLGAGLPLVINEAFKVRSTGGSGR